MNPKKKVKAKLSSHYNFGSKVVCVCDSVNQLDFLNLSFHHMMICLCVSKLFCLFFFLKSIKNRHDTNLEICRIQFFPSPLSQNFRLTEIQYGSLEKLLVIFFIVRMFRFHDPIICMCEVCVYVCF